MASPEVQGIDESKLFTEQAIALSILRNLTVEQLDALKARLGLSHPGVIGPMTLDSFVSYFKDVGVDLTPAGVSAFKNAHNFRTYALTTKNQYLNDFWGRRAPPKIVQLRKS